jgi:DnaJ-class molecular chaperone
MSKGIIHRGGDEHKFQKKWRPQYEILSDPEKRKA